MLTANRRVSPSVVGQGDKRLYMLSINIKAFWISSEVV